MLIIPFQYIQAAAYLTLSSFSGPATEVEVQGGGWIPGETITLYLFTPESGEVATVTAGEDSFFNVQINIPDNTPQGPLPIFAKGSETQELQSNSYYIVPFTPTITVSGNNTPGSLLSIDGNGFAPDETISFTIQGKEIGITTANADGSFQDASATVPTIAFGTYELTATGQSSAATTIDYFYVGGFFPSISPSTYYVLPTQSLSFSGSGFATHEEIQVYKGDDGSPLASIQADANGSFTDAGTIPIPLSLTGSQTFTLRGNTSNAEASVDITIGTFTPNVTPSTHYLLPEETLMFSGGGYAIHETIDVYETSNPTEPIATFSSDSDGNFFDAGAIVIPYDWLNSIRTFTLIGQTSGGQAEVALTIGSFNSLVEPSSYHNIAGHTISFSGSGFGNSETIVVTEGNNSTPLASFTSDSTGTFLTAGTFTIPFTWSNSSRTIVLSGTNSKTEATVLITIAPFTPQVSPNNYYILPGTDVSFTGTGFGTDEEVQVMDDVTGELLTTITTDVDGAFTEAGAITIPYTWQETRLVRFEGQESQAKATVSLSIGTFYPTLSPSSYYILPAEPFTVSGSGFAPEDIVEIRMNDRAPIEVETDEEGVLIENAPFVAPLSGSRITIHATGMKSGLESKLEISLGSLYPMVTPQTWYLPAGSPLTFSGDGFAPGENIIMRNDGNMLETTQADIDGHFENLTVTTGFESDGSETYVFIGQESGGTSEVTVTIAALTPYIELDSYYALPGTPVHVSGVGFAPNEPVTIEVGETSINAYAEHDGTVSPTPVVIPLGLSNSTVPVKITGGMSNATGITTLTLAPFTPQVTPSTWYTAPGSQISFSGTGFSGEEPVSISLNDEILAETVSSTAGEIDTEPITIPVTTTGGATFIISGTNSGAFSEVTITLSGFTPEVTPNTWYTPAGSYVTFEGSGFAASEEIRVTLNDTPLSTLSTNEFGTFADTKLQIPYGATEVIFTFSGQLSATIVSVPITVAPLTSGIELSHYYGFGGEALTVSGMGFGAGEDVIVTFDGLLLGTTTADESGNLIFNTTVPGFLSGERTVSATGASTGSTATANFIHGEVYLGAELGSYAGAPGTAIQFIGSGYLPNEPIQIRTDRTGEEVVHSFNANTSGSFSNDTYIIPTDVTEGPLTLMITGEYSVKPVEIVYYVTGG